MKLNIFGKEFEIIRKEGDKTQIDLENNKIFICSEKEDSESELKSLLKNLLKEEIIKIIDHLSKETDFEIYGDLIIEVFEDGKMLARQKGNLLMFNLKLIEYPKDKLKEVIAHELAHFIVKKRHTLNFYYIFNMLLTKSKNL